jgi:DNA-binding GntR family transcriptional regulator
MAAFVYCIQYRHAATRFEGAFMAKGVTNDTCASSPMRRRAVAPKLARPPLRRGDGAPPPAARRESVLPSVAKYHTLEELAYRDIRQAIVEGSLAPGQRIVANTIAAAAGISRIPVMQALRRLESEGFVRITPHKHVVVTSLSPGEFRERFLLMATLEGLCLRESAGKIGPETVGRLRVLQAAIAAARKAGDAARAVAADGEFHRLLWDASGLRQVSQILQNIWDRGEYYRIVMHARRGGFAIESLAEHEQIIKALEAGDVARAARAIEHHRMRAMERLQETT